MTGKDIWRIVQTVLKRRGIETSVEQYNRYYAIANYELKDTLYGRGDDPTGFETNGVVKDELLPFLVFASVSVPSGLGELPSDYWHKVDFSASGKEGKFVTHKEWLRRNNNTITAPSTEYPIAKIANGYIYVLPTSISTIQMTYLKKGNVPQVVLKNQNSIFVYDDTNSIEPSFNENKFIDIARLICSYYSVPMNNEQLLAYAEQKTDKEN
jgi:hypothetical protein